MNFNRPGSIVILHENGRKYKMISVKISGSLRHPQTGPPACEKTVDAAAVLW